MPRRDPRSECRTPRRPPRSRAPAARLNFAILIPARGGMGDWKSTTIGDDIAWIQPAADGRLYGDHPRAGYFAASPLAPTQDQLHAWRA